jgi:hypothetical protein
MKISLKITSVLLLLTLIAFTNCESNQKEDTKLIEKEKSTFLLKKDFTKEKILTFLFEDVNEEETIRWKPYPKELVFTDKSGFATSNVDSVIYFKNNTGNFALVVTRNGNIENKMDVSCASCTVSLGLALFKDTYNYWQLEKFNRNIGSFGYAGSVPNKKIVSISDTENAILFMEEPFQDQARCYFFALDDFKEIYSGYHSNLNPEMSIYQENEIVFTKTTNEYFSLKIRTKSVDVIKDKELPFKEKIYTFDEYLRKYVFN